jgi:methylated-DNA-protein-cysteine methyltransferase related protein
MSAKRHGARSPRAKAADPEQSILAAVRRIPRGRVSSYGEIARLAGLPRRARLVGTVLRHTAARVPWHRVINAGGRISFPAGSDACQRQRRLLEQEGIAFRRDRIDVNRYGWPDRETDLDRALWLK